MTNAPDHVITNALTTLVTSTTPMTSMVMAKSLSLLSAPSYYSSI